MPISSYVVRCLPADQAAVRAQLLALPGVELGEATEKGFPVVTDTPTTRAATELGERLQDLPGVQSAVLVYHNFEDVAADPSAAATLPKP